MDHSEIKLLELMAKNKIREIKELHELSGISRTTISQLLNGDKKAIRLDTIEKLCRALKCDIGDLIVLKKDPEEQVKEVATK